jgi:predicted ATP-dependent protease
VPKEVLNQLQIIPVAHVDEVLRIALVLEEKDPLKEALGDMKKAIKTEKAGKASGPHSSNLM